MVTPKELTKYSDILEKINVNSNDVKKNVRCVELFFSFDIVNSSIYKDINFFGWQSVLVKLLTDIQRDVTKSIPEAQLWRVLGDEIIFFVTIRGMDEIYERIDEIYTVLNMANKKIKEEQFFEKCSTDFSKKQVEWMKQSNIIAVQSAAWIAIISNSEETSYLASDNIFKKYRISEHQQINEFLGQDIDTGFRIKKETQERRLIVSVELAKLLSEKTEYLSRLNIITYKKLKGVWQNRVYPIIWYHDDVISEVTFEDSFYYDETTYSSLSKEYFLNREKEDGDITSYMFSDVHRALEKVIKDQRLNRKIEEIKKVIDDTEDDFKSIESEFNSNLLEFHCAAVCCDVENKKVLIVKRKNRDVYSNVWEFGCAKASTDEDLCESIREDYKNDFGIDIEIICDESRVDKEPKPIALYQINKIEKKQKGVIVVAKIESGIDRIDETIKLKDKHEEYKWISEEEVEEFNKPTINDFKDTLKKVFYSWEDLFKVG